MNRACKLNFLVEVFVSSVLFVPCLRAQTNLLDFSTCGYAAQSKPIPTAPVRVVIDPRPGNNTARIQRALDYVGELRLDTNGLRGAVLLLRGRHEVFGGLLITNSGVILRGQGSGEDGTVLVAAGLDRRTLIRVSGPKDSSTNALVPIVSDVPLNTISVLAGDTSGIRPLLGPIRITRHSTSNWIDQLRATEFGGGVGGDWKPGTHDITWDRTVITVLNNSLILDRPLTTAIEGPGIGSCQSAPSFRITNFGIENLVLESTFDNGNPKDENHSWCAITMDNVADAWVRQVTFKHFAGSAVALYETCQRVTVQDCLSLAPVSEIGGYRRHTFFTMGQQTLFLRCYAGRGRHDFSVGHCAVGPNAFVQCESREALDDSGGFPEPPPYVGDKRIFQAELFYDVVHPVRRKLHEGYIRQCLDNFKNNANVIQFTSAEFTGPLHFMQFWLDTIAQWRSERPLTRPSDTLSPDGGEGVRRTGEGERRPLVALSATKDVQDAILADPKRGAIVDVIDFRYWWRTDKGEFLPPGGKNLAPRQFERQWRDGRPNDTNLASMGAEFRARFPTKPLICDFDAAAWAWVCAGGSMPRLPKTTDAKLLAAIPKMQPWLEASKGGSWALREAGKQMLICMAADGQSGLYLRSETGDFYIHRVDLVSGDVVGYSKTVQGGGVMRLPRTGDKMDVFWLAKVD